MSMANIRASTSSQDSVNLDELLGSQIQPTNGETFSSFEEVDVVMEEDFGDEMEDDGLEGGEPDDGSNPFGKKERQKKLFVWQEFEVNRETKKARCIHCSKLIKLQAGGTTSSLKNHLLKTCTIRKQASQKQKVLNFPSANSEVQAPTTSSIVYDHAKQREAVAQWVLATNQSFRVVDDPTFTRMLQVNLPFYKRITRTRERDDCMEVYHSEKGKLKKLLKSVETISITTDIWKSMPQKKSYMVITGHWVDRDWKLQKRILSFTYLKPPHKGYEIAVALKDGCEDWGIEGKVISISLDNASNNNVAIRLLKTNFWKERHLALGGMLFHVRCCAHILNLVVKDGTKLLKPMILTVHKTIKWLHKSEGKQEKFSSILQTLGYPDHKLVKHVKHRWNSTYEMLDSAMKVKEAFTMLACEDREYQDCPTDAEWVILEKVMKLLEVFYKAIHAMSATDYPTANRFLRIIWKVKHALIETTATEDPDLSEMVSKMREKFDKYWGDCNMLMSLGAILDPRYKMVLVKFCFTKIYGVEGGRTNLKQVEKGVKDLYAEYAAEFSKEQGSSSSMAPRSSVPSTAAKKNIMDEGDMEFLAYVNSSTTIPKAAELDGYLIEPILQPPNEDFDALSWWKAYEKTYPVLSRMARDILAIPITSVASESAFSTSGRVVDVYRSSLKPETVQALVCGGDWVRRMHGDGANQKASSEPDDELAPDERNLGPIQLAADDDSNDEEEDEEVSML